MDDEEQRNSDTDGFGFPEYEVVAQLWVSAQVNDGLYQSMEEFTLCSTVLMVFLPGHGFPTFRIWDQMSNQDNVERDCIFTYSKMMYICVTCFRLVG